MLGLSEQAVQAVGISGGVASLFMAARAETTPPAGGAAERPAETSGTSGEDSSSTPSSSAASSSSSSPAPEAAEAAEGRGEGESASAGEEEVKSSSEQVDSLPAELDVSSYVGPYVFPNNSRRRMPGVIYLFLGVVLAAAWGLTLNLDLPWVNGGYLIAAVALLLLGGYHFLAGKELRIDENDAFLIAVKEVGFPVGHASAQMGWRGWGSRPTWRILVFSNEPQPARRGLVLIDGVDGEVLEAVVEENPEDWSSLKPSDTPSDTHETP